MINLKEVKQQLAILFKKNGIDMQEIDVLISESLSVPLSRVFLLENISIKSYKKIIRYAKKRCSGMPITKIFKTAYFYKMKFYVNKNVLSPRQETEQLVENALKLIRPEYKVLDLCTGSGVIAVSLAKNCNAIIYASDICCKALKVAKKNAKINDANVKFIHSNLFDKINEKFDMIISNPPYIPSNQLQFLSKEVKHYDPVIALDGGVDGLKFYKNIIEQSLKYLTCEGNLLLEIGFDQFDGVEKLLKQNNFDTILVKDYYGNNRIIIAKLKKESIC